MIHKRLWRSSVLLIVLLMSTLPAYAQRPDPHNGGTGLTGAPATAEASPVADPGCDLVVPYTRELYQAIDDSGAFATFFQSDADFGDVSASQAKEIIRDGNALIEKLKGMDVPPAYADAHQGIIVFFQIEIDTARFFGLDTSVVPDLNAESTAFDQIEAGEVAIAQACPAQIRKVGGFILINPETEDAVPTAPVTPNN